MEKNNLLQTVHIKLEAFEGPFDLLFHLIEKNQINIYDIPIADLADQYLAVINNYPGDMEFISGFILMAASLLEIKSRMLLPKPPKDIPEEDPREVLVERLLEYKKYKQLAEELRGYEAEGIKHLFREPEEGLFKLLKTKRSASVGEILSDLHINQFYEIYIETLLRRELRADKVKAAYDAIPADAYTIEENTEYLRAMLIRTPQLGFFSILRPCKNKVEKVTTFLAMLELIKNKSVKFSQEDIFEDILLERLI